ncbi:MAG: cell division protein ZapB [Desulfobaccales bacterium]
MVTDIFTVLEQKLEMVVGQIARLKEVNTVLEQTLAEKEKALKEAKADLEKLTQEREMIRQRIDKILNRLKIIDTGESA